MIPASPSFLSCEICTRHKGKRLSSSRPVVTVTSTESPHSIEICKRMGLKMARPSTPIEIQSHSEGTLRTQCTIDSKHIDIDEECVVSGSSVRIFRFDTDPFCWYVVEEASRLALVDAGFPGHYFTFRSGIERLGFGIKDVVGIVLTHAHTDHTGFAARLSREADAPIFVHRDDAIKARRILQLPWLTLLGNAWRPWCAGMLWHATRNGIFTCPRIRQVQTIADGQELDIPGRPVVIHTPGHTPGHASLHVKAASALLAGDAILTQSLRTGRVQQPLVPEKPYNEDDREARRSIARLRGLGEIIVLPGHGHKWTGDSSELGQQCDAGN